MSQISNSVWVRRPHVQKYHFKFRYCLKRDNITALMCHLGLVFFTQNVTEQLFLSYKQLGLNTAVCVYEICVCVFTYSHTLVDVLMYTITLFYTCVLPKWDTFLSTTYAISRELHTIELTLGKIPRLIIHTAVSVFWAYQKHKQCINMEEQCLGMISFKCKTYQTII